MTSVVRKLTTGVVAGALGTLAMDLVWYRRYRRGGGEDTFAGWEFATSTSSFDEASAPGQVGHKLASTLGVTLPDHTAGLTTNVMHWLAGVGYGAAHGLVFPRRGPVVGGLATGVGAFANSYATLGAMGVYQPIWEYDTQVLAKDLSAHLLFGLVAGAAFRALQGR
ncbi:MAG: hypothetical protein WEB03_08690 [Nitriliruptor sp.]|uniref:hypothetical protein n=1 Tax=Nitriliruptor sp. TaxID=2448056 RepID=UPI00349FD457